MSCFLFVFVCFLNLCLSLIEIAWRVWNNIELKNLDLCPYRSDLHAEFVQCKLPSNPDSTNNQTVCVCELIKNMFRFSSTWPSRCNPTNFRIKLKIFATIDEKEKKMSNLNILGHIFTQNIFYRFGYVDGKIVLLQKLSENFSHCSESQTTKFGKVFCFLLRFRALKSTDILWSHERRLKKTRQSVTKLVFDWHAMCGLAKN